MKKWKFSSGISAILAFGCLVTMLLMNQSPEPKSQDVPWLIGFLVCLIATPFFWRKGNQEGE